MVKQYTIRIPWVPAVFATVWHPTDMEGPFSVLHRGCFSSEDKAIIWAQERLNGTPYQIVEIMC
jgi:hypothetical protein